MTDVIKVKNASYILYEELLLKRENLRKEAEQYYVGYLKVFGDLLTESFERKVECIRKKKMIAYCQRCLNQGKEINLSELNRYIKAEMEAYQAQLQEMADNVKAAAASKSVSGRDYQKIKEIYYRLARKIHPDMRPDLAGDEQLRDYWNQIVIAYQHNHLNELEELEVLVNGYLEGKDIPAGDIVIVGIEEKIKRLEEEIERIISTPPYTYRFLLEDEAQKAQKKQELQNDIRDYEAYSGQLDEILNTFSIKEMYA